MLKNWLSVATFGALALMLTPGISSAQRGGGGGRGGSGGGSGGYHGGGGYNHGGYGGGGYNHGGYTGGGYNHGGYNHGGYYGGSGFGIYLGSPGYGLGGYNRGYGSPYYGSSYDYGPAYTFAQPSNVTPSYYYAPETSAPAASVGNPNPDAASLEVRVPDGAELWFEGDKTTQTGATRYFVSPALQTGKTFTYDIRARWTGADGKPVDRTKQVKVQAGARIGVDFNNP